MPTKPTRTTVSRPPSGLRIGAVSRITRISVDTLRGWERRYAVVAPNRDLQAVRLYNQDDVERLTCIKRLVDAGHAIGSVAKLARAELEAILALHVSQTHASERDTVADWQIACYSDCTQPIDSAQTGTEGVTVIGQYANWIEFEGAVMDKAPRALVIGMAALMPERVDEILRLLWRSAAARVVVCYGFAPAVLVDRLEREGVIALQSPVSHSQILRELTRAGAPAVEAETRTDPHPRLFADSALVEMARLSTSVACECPQHLIGIIRSLNAFEFYSANCEHQNADDAVVHAMLRGATGHARALMERALLELATLEDMPLPVGMRKLR